jgi:isoleucyl-tRNA synthetase
MVAVALDRRAPYTDVYTHGWVLDAQGRAMHKSLGNVIAPQDLIDRLGADILRWWALATDWRNDVRAGEEILQRVAEAYRKVRNTFRFLLGNLSDFDASRSLPAKALTRVDRVFADYLVARCERMRRDYDALLFHRVLDALLDLCTVDLSAVFLDVAKDRLYTLAPDDPLRLSAQSVLWQALHDLAIAASPALVFTAEEVWQSHSGLVAEAESVHLATWPGRRDSTSNEEEWRFLLDVRDAVNGAIEPLRASRQLNTTAEADVTLHAPRDMERRLEPYRDELAGFLMVADAHLSSRPSATTIEVTVERTSWIKCERCWMHRADTAHQGPHAGLCGRCAAVLGAIQRSADAGS